MSKSWMVVHPGTGTIISLSDPVYLLDGEILDEKGFDKDNENDIIRMAEKFGHRIDNYAATNIYRP